MHMETRMGLQPGPTLLQWQARLRAVRGLDLAFLIATTYVRSG